MRSRTIELTIEGPVREEALEYLEDSGVRRAADHTVLEAEIRDTAALFGLLQRMGSLGLDVVGLRTTDAGGRPDVEIVVRGAVGPLMAQMLGDENAALRSSSHTYHLEDVQLADLLVRVETASHDDRSRRAPDRLMHRAGSSTPRTNGTGTAPVREEEMMDVDLEVMGPVDYLVVEFPKDRLDGTAFPLLVDLVDRGIIRVLDLAFVTKDADGIVTGVELHDLDTSGDVDMTIFAGASSSLLGDDDLEEVGAALEPGSAAGVLVYENAWAAPFAAALRKGGGQLVAGGRIPIQAILAALDASEDE
ncbi:DUF6325 family protein [Cellulomonas composti]|uniref:DUF1269 domain-containing protein n=1 Tax=Cellulomonas composti TaxID=266130 RepID=A0A511J5X2_9CELL|nr:DUF6325 family protein [Cellulomonas composti]GEL93412.1 hypothetical protein CCO02nite_00700 [Cellulomonas composti]